MKFGTEFFINHDDKVDEGKLSEAYKWTCKAYASATNGEVYIECIFWHCETVREATINSSFPLINPLRLLEMPDHLHNVYEGSRKFPSALRRPLIYPHTPL
jgi:hypothetical protein